jgi:hypothetical protein
LARCEGQSANYGFGLAPNERRQAPFGYAQGLAAMRFAATGEPVRRFEEMEHRTLDAWSRTHGVVAQVECTARGFHPRFVVSQLDCAELQAQALTRTSTAPAAAWRTASRSNDWGCSPGAPARPRLPANQVRPCCACVGCARMRTLRRPGLERTEPGSAPCDTIRMRLLEIGARVTTWMRRIVVSLSQAFPVQALSDGVLE